MPYAVLTMAASAEEAENQIRRDTNLVTVLWSREIDLEGLPPLAGGPLPRHWAVVVRHRDAQRDKEIAEREGLSDGDDPAEACERRTRLMYLQMATDPELLSTGTIEQFPCPSCGERAEVHLAPLREVRYPEHSTCDKCGSHLRRNHRGEQWQVKALGAKPRCVFCGASANSHEHVIPKWISKRLGIRGFLPPEDVLIFGDEERHQPISFSGYRARIMCAECNEHFKHLEDQTLPVLLAMARGWGVPLDGATQELVARWATKTAIALTAAVPDLRSLVPEDHARAVRAGYVAPDTWVGIFPWRGSPVVGGGRMFAFDTQSPARRSGYCALLAFGQVGFYSVGLHERDETDILDAERVPLVQLWPPRTRPLRWPPPGQIDKSSVRRLFDVAPLLTPDQHRAA